MVCFTLSANVHHLRPMLLLDHDVAADGRYPLWKLRISRATVDEISYNYKYVIVPS